MGCGYSTFSFLLFGQFDMCLIFSLINESFVLLFKRLSLFGFFIFLVQKCPTPLCLSRDKTKGQSGKNATLTPNKILPKK